MKINRIILIIITIINAASLRSPQISADEPNSEIVAAWNNIAYEIAYAEDQFLTFKGQRALSLMHLAVHDALNSIEPKFERYVCSHKIQDGDPVAAAASAAFEVLLSQYPDRETVLKEERAVWLNQVADGLAKKRGIALGRSCATTILNHRKNDRWNQEAEYKFGKELGQYQTTGSWDGFVMQPGFRFAKPFFLESPDQFRPTPPPPLESMAYTEAFHEVKEVGESESKHRSADQTGYAVWWMEFAEASVNRLARQLLEKEDVELWTASRMFAYLNVSLYDGYIAVWDGKYEYNHWRPVTAIQMAAVDGNKNTIPDNNWNPLRPTAPFPDYPSAHAAACAASFGILEHTFGPDYSFVMETDTAPQNMPTRSFKSFEQAARECADSRIQLGWHFRYAADEGLKLGRKVRNYLVRHTLQPE